MSSIEALQRRSKFLADEAKTADQTVAALDERAKQLAEEVAAVKAARKTAAAEAKKARLAAEQAVNELRSARTPTAPEPGAPVVAIAGAATGSGSAQP